MLKVLDQISSSEKHKSVDAEKHKSARTEWKTPLPKPRDSKNTTANKKNVSERTKVKTKIETDNSNLKQQDKDDLQLKKVLIPQC